jgi:hypothetical protein
MRRGARDGPGREQFSPHPTRALLAWAVFLQGSGIFGRYALTGGRVAFFNVIVAVPLASFWWSLCLLLYGWTVCGQIFRGLIGRSG